MNILIIKFILLIVILILLTFIISTILTYYILKWMNKNINFKSYFNSYKKKCKIVLDKYGDCPVKRIYIVRRPVPFILRFALDIITCKSYSNQLDNYRNINKIYNFYPMHTAIVIEIKLKNKLRKLITIEKSNALDITPYFIDYYQQDVIKIKLDKNDNFTINKILNLTKGNMGSDLFYNWHFYKNNCQKFILKILESINKKKSRYEKFIYQKNMTESIKFSELHLYLANNLNNLYSFIENSYYNLLL